jgi:hypothetical protein
MAASSLQATALPRFLLPQLSWSTRAIRPAALRALEARRHRSSPTFGPCATTITTPITIALQRQPIREWQRRTPQFAAGYTSALEFRRHFSATAPQQKDHHFDTLKFVQRLKDEGFSEEQAEGMMKILSDVIEERYVAAKIHNAQN